MSIFYDDFSLFFRNGNHQFQSPNNFIKLGTSIRRIIVASRNIANATPRPICRTGKISVKAKAPVTTIIINAADVIILLVETSPSNVA